MPKPVPINYTPREQVTFLASFPPIQSAIKVGQDGMRLQLDVPESEMDVANAVLRLRGRVFRVTLEPEDDY